MKAKFEIFETGGKYRFQLKAANGEVVADSQEYDSESAARKGVEAVRRAAADASIEQGMLNMRREMPPGSH